jgi:hypothetical protein
MTDNQQKIIDSLIAEFNSRNEKTSNKLGGLIDLDALDAINQRHRDLTADSERTKNLWNQQRREYIDNLVEQIRDEIGHRLCVNRGDIATGDKGFNDRIYIYKHGDRKHEIYDKGLNFSVWLTYEMEFDAITRQYYQNYNGLIIKSEEKYKDEVEFFNCQHTKNALKNLLA